MRLHRSALLFGTCLAGMVALPATAQDTTQATGQGTDAPSSQADVVVTGTRLARDPNATAPSPVNVVTADDIRAQGQTDAAEALREIPALANSGTIGDSIDRGEGGVG